MNLTPEVVAVGGAVACIDDAGRPLWERPYPLDHGGVLAWQRRGETALSHPAAMIRSSALEAVGGYDERYAVAQDYDLWWRLSEVGKLANLPEVLLDYRLHDRAIGGRRKAEQQAAVRASLRRHAERLDASWDLPCDVPPTADRLRSRLGWASRALGSLHLPTARHHAWAVARRRPWLLRAWGILALSLAPPPGARAAARRPPAAAGERGVSDGLRVDWVFDTFPTVVETFIVRQICGLLDRGLDVRLVVRKRGRIPVRHELIERYRLEDRATFAPLPPRRLALRPLAAARRAGAFAGAGYVGALPRLISKRHFGRRAPSLRPIFESIPWLDGRSPDVVVGSYGNHGRDLVELRRLGLLDAPIVSFFRGHDGTQVPAAEPGCYRRLFAEGELCLTVSDALRRNLLALGCPPEKVQTLREGLDLSQFPATDAPPRGSGIPGEPGFPGGPLRVVGVGRLVPMKGFADGIRAVAAAAAAGTVCDYRIAGDGPLRGELEKLIDELGLRDRVHLLGWQSVEDVKREVAAAHVMLAPSKTPPSGVTEGVPNVLKEALALGRPVIATRHGGNDEVVDPGVNGRLVDEGDVAAMAEGLHAAAADSAGWRAMGRAGRDVVERQYNLGPLSDRLARLLQETAERYVDRNGSRRREPAT